MDVGKQITFFRTEKGYSVNKLAALSGISQSYLREIELGNKNPTVEILTYLCDALGITLGEFFNTEAKSSFLEEPLIKLIYQLTPEQRETLTAFLSSMTGK